jgi:hypothetical protein
MDKAKAVIDLAVSLLGCPYVYGAWGQLCTPALRKKYAKYTPSQAEITYKRCPVLSNKQATCAGCKYNGLLAFDCRGFTHYCLLKGADIDIYGQKVSVQYGTDSNWDVRGDIALMPDLVSCVFLEGHTGLYLGDGQIVHCSVEVKQERLGEGRKWINFAIPKGLYTMTEIVEAIAAKGPELKLLKRGDKGLSVMYLQALLKVDGYDCGLIDGVYGAKTVGAVTALQEACGIRPDGVCGPATWALLVKSDQPELDEDDDKLPEQPDTEPDPPFVEKLVTMTQSQYDELRQYIKSITNILDEVMPS